MKMWIARDSDNELFLFESEPVLRGCDETDYLWYEPLDKFERCSKLDEFLFPEVTFENSPMEVELAIRSKAIENAIYTIMREKFGILDTEGIKNFALKHNCALCYDADRNFIGISVNNRWLYTETGKVIGKKGKRWMIEKINYGNTNKERLA